ncbi:hypothetical protein UlMin_036053 [Ulmus minor]
MGKREECLFHLVSSHSPLAPHKPRSPNKTPIYRLLIEGSKEWNNLCNDEFNHISFLDGHFDPETVLEAELRPLTVRLEKSFVGFFFLEKFEMLKEIISNETLANKPKIYIVSWNDHFFVLKEKETACYVIDSLGERLRYFCNNAYILQFKYEKECSREFIKRFWTTTTLNELEEKKKKGSLSNITLFQKLQIEFRCTYLTPPPPPPPS